MSETTERRPIETAAKERDKEAVQRRLELGDPRRILEAVGILEDLKRRNSLGVEGEEMDALKYVIDHHEFVSDITQTVIWHKLAMRRGYLGGDQEIADYILAGLLSYDELVDKFQRLLGQPFEQRPGYLQYIVNPHPGTFVQGILGKYLSMAYSIDFRANARLYCAIKLNNEKTDKDDFAVFEETEKLKLYPSSFESAPIYKAAVPIVTEILKKDLNIFDARRFYIEFPSREMAHLLAKHRLAGGKIEDRRAMIAEIDRLMKTEPPYPKYPDGDDGFNKFVFDDDKKRLKREKERWDEAVRFYKLRDESFKSTRLYRASGKNLFEEVK